MQDGLTINKCKKVIIEMFKGYPDFSFWGLFEKEFGKERGGWIVKLLKKEGLIRIEKLLNQEGYRLTQKGINFAISMISLEYSEKVLKYSEKMRKFTIAIIVLSILTLGFGLIQLFIKLPIIDILLFFR